MRAGITVIPQEPTLLNGSLRFNLDPMDLQTDATLLELIQKAGLDKILQKDSCDESETKNILDMKIESGGSNMSAGERQLLCLCRAILRESKVVILDEATASIDVLTEQKVQRLVAEEFKNATVLTIAHRINTIVQCDKVLVLEAGKVLEYGSPVELAGNQKSHFAQMIEQIKVNCKDFI